MLRYSILIQFIFVILDISCTYISSVQLFTQLTVMGFAVALVSA
jgi:hypothetical protein